MAETDKKKRALPKGRHKSQIKRERQNLKKHARNQMGLSHLKTAIRKVKTAVLNKDKTLAQNLLKQASSIIQKTASKGMIHSRNATRKISRLSSLVHSLS